MKPPLALVKITPAIIPKARKITTAITTLTPSTKILYYFDNFGIRKCQKIILFVIFYFISIISSMVSNRNSSNNHKLVRKNKNHHKKDDVIILFSIIIYLCVNFHSVCAYSVIKEKNLYNSENYINNNLNDTDYNHVAILNDNNFNYYHKTQATASTTVDNDLILDDDNDKFDPHHYYDRHAWNRKRRQSRQAQKPNYNDSIASSIPPSTSSSISAAAASTTFIHDEDISKNPGWTRDRDIEQLDDKRKSKTKKCTYEKNC